MNMDLQASEKKAENSCILMAYFLQHWLSLKSVVSGVSCSHANTLLLSLRHNMAAWSGATEIREQEWKVNILIPWLQVQESEL